MKKVHIQLLLKKEGIDKAKLLDAEKVAVVLDVFYRRLSYLLFITEQSK
ncbi:hypothetical protein [Peribacillus sp. NPDC097295]